MKHRHRRHKEKGFRQIVCIDLCVTTIIILLGLMVWIVAPDFVVGILKYLQNINDLLVYSLPVVALGLMMSWVADIIYVLSKEPTMVVEGYTKSFMWSKVGVVFFSVLAVLVAGFGS